MSSTIELDATSPISVPRPLKVVLVALYYEYGRPERGLSYEYHSFYLCLQKIFEQVQFFDYYSLFLEKGKNAMNDTLLAFIQSEKPDLTIFALYQDEFRPEVIVELKDYTTTLCYFFDDLWRVEFADFWAPHFHYVTTCSTSCLRRYTELGYKQVIYSPFGYNHFIFQKKDLPKRYDVSFVGGSHPYRGWVINQLRKANIDVAVWGGGTWPAGRLTYEEMIDVFNQTKINLNISNSVSWHLPYLVTSLRAVQIALKSKKTKESLKARLFEVGGCGGFQLTHYVEDLERCYEIGREIGVYMDMDDLIAKIRYYLKHDDERESIAEAGYSKALADHTYAKRFTEIVDRIFGPHLGSGSQPSTSRLLRTDL